MLDVAFAIKFIVLLIAYITGFSIALYAIALVIAAFRKLLNKNARSVRSNEKESRMSMRNVAVCKLCGHTGPKTEMSKIKNSQASSTDTSTKTATNISHIRL